MHLEPKDLCERLEFDKVLQLLEKECLGELGKEAVRHLAFSADVNVIEQQLKEVSEYKLSIEKNDHFPLSVYEDLAEDLKMLDIEDYVLAEDSWKRIHNVLSIMGDIMGFFTPDRQKIYPTLFNIIRPVNFDPALAASIDKVFDEHGEIRPDASPALSKIRREIINKQKELDKVFRSLINEYRNKGYLTDNVESVRNNRRVFSVPSEHKRKIRGIIHDESATGRTAFIEPEPVIEINNDIFDLEQEERREIWRILKELSATFRPFTPQMRLYQSLLIRFDVILSKARLATQMNGRMPKISGGGSGSRPTQKGVPMRNESGGSRSGSRPTQKGVPMRNESGGSGSGSRPTQKGVPMRNESGGSGSRSDSDIPLRQKADASSGSSATEQSPTPKSIGAIPRFGIEMARHPLLLLKNRKTGKEVVPFDLTLFGENRIVIVSGPNAGGKSILMKSVGLIQLMLQAGMLVPVDEISEMGVFQKMFADIGDQQSIEDDLSTYSSRLANMKAFLQKADENSLVLIDEFGSGTDPKMGGAIAEAILQELNERKVFGVITTHYSNLKMFAFKTRGIVNGSMLFDKENLSPTYQFKVGRPGSSYAFEIAQKSGLSKKIIAYARMRTGKSETAVDDLLIDLQREKKEVEDKLQSMGEREKQLEKLIKSYEELHRDLEYKKKKQKLEAKEQALQEVARENKELDRLVREIREGQNLEKAKQLVTQAREERQQLESTVSDLRSDVYDVPLATHKEAKKGVIRAGDFVRMRNGGTNGMVESVDKKKAIVHIGQMRMTVHIKDLEHAREPLDVKSTISIQSDTISQNAGFENKLDIRGMTMEDAIAVVQDFLDRALLTSASNLRIVHGKGTGVLRNVVRKKLQEYREVKNAYHPAPDDGGDGVTVVEF